VLSHHALHLLPKFFCLIDLFVGLTWLQISDAQNKSAKLFTLTGPLVSMDIGVFIQSPFLLFFCRNKAKLKDDCINAQQIL
jgi:hypothetical protein